jgi:uncharacterized membrane protein
MTRKNTLTSKEKKYVAIGMGVILIILFILGFIAYNNLFGSNKTQGKIEMELEQNSIKTGEETKLKVTVKNTGKDLMEGEIIIIPDDFNAVNVTHPDMSVLNVKLYSDESITRIFTVKGTTNAIRTDYKIFAEIKKGNETTSSNDVVLTVTKE